MQTDLAEVNEANKASLVLLRSSGHGLIPIGFMIWIVVGRDRWARRVGFGGPSGPALPPLAKSIVQYSTDVGIKNRVLQLRACTTACASFPLLPSVKRIGTHC